MVKPTYSLFTVGMPMLAMAAPLVNCAPVDAADSSDSTTVTSSGNAASSSSAASSASSSVASSTSSSAASSTASSVASSTASSGASSVAASTSSSASTSTATSGAIFGTDGVAKCTDLYSYTHADWLMTALCAVTKCAHMWTEQSVAMTGGGDIYDAEYADFTVYSMDMVANTTTVYYADVAGTLGDNMGDDAWFGGGFDKSVVALGGNTTVDGKLLSNDDDSTELIEMAGVYGLMYIAGKPAVRESIPSDTSTWATWMGKAPHTPILIRTNDDPDSLLTANIYYSINTFVDTATDITVWNPRGTSDNQYIDISISALQTSSKWLYHLDWARFTSTS